MKFHNLLEQIGLSGKEIKIYETTLQMPPSRAKAIALQADIARPTTYDILKVLIEKALIREVDEGGVKLFACHPPDALIEHIETKQAELENYRKEAKKLLPTLEKLRFKEFSYPTIAFASNGEALFQLKKYIETSSMCHILFDNKAENVQVEELIENTQWKNTDFKIILPDSKENQEFAKLSEKDCHIHPTLRSLKNDTFIFDTHMALLTYDKKLKVTTLEDEEILVSQKAIFDTLRG